MLIIAWLVKKYQIGIIRLYAKSYQNIEITIL